MRVLVVEDEARMADVIRSSLVKEGIAADIASCCEDALWMSEAAEYAAIVLDVMLPGLAGLGARRVRDAHGERARAPITPGSDAGPGRDRPGRGLSPARRRMSRAPIRLRVATAFAAAMALVLAGTGLFLYTQLGADLSNALDQDLRLRAQDLSQVVRDPRGSLSRESGRRLIERGESFAQLLTPSGAVLDGTVPLGHRPLLRGAELRRARRRPVFADRPAVPGLDEPARLLATPVIHAGRTGVPVVGAP